MGILTIRYILVNLDIKRQFIASSASPDAYKVVKISPAVRAGRFPEKRVQNNLKSAHFIHPLSRFH